ncbi:MAG: 2Fe-2S iron-sulfur cluster binding domain-containing protein, partial [Bacteroidales bacterium]|nr:2Fe-2S iron-sulfur cluster binding domain-containing protein [Bacteroidales bacterium]
MILLDVNTIMIIATSVIAFLLISLLLVAMLLFAKKKLTPQGKVKLIINETKELEVEPGNSVLSTLSNNKIFLPSACGGKGTCGMCTCRVTEGGGSILPTETGFFNRKEQQNYWRLGC